MKYNIVKEIVYVAHNGVRLYSQICPNQARKDIQMQEHLRWKLISILYSCPFLNLNYLKNEVLSWMSLTVLSSTYSPTLVCKCCLHCVGSSEGWAVALLGLCSCGTDGSVHSPAPLADWTSSALRRARHRSLRTRPSAGEPRGARDPRRAKHFPESDSLRFSIQHFPCPLLAHLPKRETEGGRERVRKRKQCSLAP